MLKKLTLSISETTILGAKRYAKAHQTSLSSLVEIYFNYLNQNKVSDGEQMSPIVKELSGIMELDQDFNLKDDYANYLLEKYLK
ncbi:MAG: DUF6364 family protein [Candidatus Marinimicrobia bacterium]|nr:DUF6364 family protein [Candidatus Neomarinimicrobiota bacterium]